MRWRRIRRGSGASQGDSQGRVRAGPGLTWKLLFGVIAIAGLSTAAMATFAIRLIGVSHEERVAASLRENAILATRMLSELEQTLLFHARLLAQVEQLDVDTPESEQQRAVVILSLQMLQQSRVEARILRAVPEEGPERDLAQKGFLGMRAAGVMMAPRGEHYLAAVAPVERRRKIDRVVMVQRLLDEQFLTDVQNKTGAFVALWHEDMPVVTTAEFRSLLPGAGDPRISELIRRAGSAREPVIRPFEGVQRPARVALAPILVAYEPAGTFVLARPLDAIVAARREMVRTILLVVGGILATAGGLGLLVARYLTQPLRRLAVAAGQVAQGAREVPVPTPTSDEVGELTRAFSHMATEVARSRQELEEWNRILEQRVAERTAKLEEAQAQLIQAGKLAALGEMAAGVAHELNNPMSAILGYAQVALLELEKRGGNGWNPEDMDQLTKYFRTIDRQAERCRVIVQHLLDFSRVNPGSFELQDIHRLLEDTLAMLEYQLRVGQVRVVKDLDRAIPPVWGNGTQLQQVFTNMILNARQAMVEGGILTLRTRQPDQGMVAIEIADTGQGIPPEIRDRIFDPFFTTRTLGQGTGLGLSVSYGIVQSHGGTLTFVSEVGRGTTFTITLPADRTNPRMRPMQEVQAS